MKPVEATCGQVNGGCLCDAVRFAVTLPSKWCAHCHCTMCRRAHGAGFVTWFGMDSQRFKLIQGDQLQWYESSPGARRGFCRICGSSMLFESSRWGGETHIALACMDSPIDRAPQANVFWDSHVDWMPQDGTLEKVSP